MCLYYLHLFCLLSNHSQWVCNQFTRKHCGDRFALCVNTLSSSTHHLFSYLVRSHLNIHHRSLLFPLIYFEYTYTTNSNKFDKIGVKSFIQRSISFTPGTSSFAKTRFLNMKNSYLLYNMFTCVVTVEFVIKHFYYYKL